MKPMLVALALLSLSGCAAFHRHDVPVRSVVSNRVFVPFSGQPGSDTNLVLVRESGLYGGGCSSRVSIDGKEVVQLEQGEQASLPLVGGNHTLALDASGACKASHTEWQTSAQPGQNLGYRISAHGSAVVAEAKADTKS